MQYSRNGICKEIAVQKKVTVNVCSLKISYMSCALISIHVKHLELVYVVANSISYKFSAPK